MTIGNYLFYQSKDTLSEKCIYNITGKPSGSQFTNFYLKPSFPGLKNWLITPQSIPNTSYTVYPIESLHLAMANNSSNKEILSLIEQVTAVDLAVDFSASNEEGLSVLHQAIINLQPENIIHSLLGNGANVKFQNGFGDVHLGLIIKARKFSEKNLLLLRERNVDLSPKACSTPVFNESDNSNIF